MLANMNKFRGLLRLSTFCPYLMGVSREDAYRLVQRNAMKVGKKAKTSNRTLGDADGQRPFLSRKLKRNLTQVTKNVEDFRAFSANNPVWESILNCQI